MTIENNKALDDATAILAYGQLLKDQIIRFRERHGDATSVQHAVDGINQVNISVIAVIAAIKEPQ